MPEAVYPDRWRLELRGGIITDRPGLTVPGFSSGTVAQRASVQKCGDTQGAHFKKMLLQMLRRRTWTVIACSHSICPYSTCGWFPHARTAIPETQLNGLKLWLVRPHCSQQTHGNS